MFASPRGAYFACFCRFIRRLAW